MVKYTCESCRHELNYYHDVYETTSKDTETKKGLLRTKEVEKEYHEGWACAYCDNVLPELVGKNLNRQFSELGSISSTLSSISRTLSTITK